MIKLTKLELNQIEVLFDACQKYYNIKTVFVKTMKKSQDRKDRSIAKHLGLAFHDRKQRAYKQASFSILLKEHEALILIEALTHYETECQNDYNKNLARKLITWIHQPSCNY